MVTRLPPKNTRHHSCLLLLPAKCSCYQKSSERLTIGPASTPPLQDNSLAWHLEEEQKVLLISIGDNSHCAYSMLILPWEARGAVFYVIGNTEIGVWVLNKLFIKVSASCLPLFCFLDGLRSGWSVTKHLTLVFLQTLKWALRMVSALKSISMTEPAHDFLLSNWACLNVQVRQHCMKTIYSLHQLMCKGRQCFSVSIQSAEGWPKPAQCFH